MTFLKLGLWCRINTFAIAAFSFFLAVLSAGLYLELEFDEQIELIEKLIGKIKVYESVDTKVFAEDHVFIHLLLKRYPPNAQTAYESIYQNNRIEINKLINELIQHPLTNDSQKNLLRELILLNNQTAPSLAAILKNNEAQGFPLVSDLKNEVVDAHGNQLALLKKIKTEQSNFVSNILLLNKQQLLSTLTIIEALIVSLGIAMFGTVSYHNKLRKHQHELEDTVRERTVELHDNIEQLNSEIERREQVEYKLYQMAYTDNLTGLPNRRSFYEGLERALENTILLGENKLFLFFLDLDGFKGVNDVFGHAAGDYCLQESSRRWQAVIPKNSTLARLGGDEFALFFNSETEYEARLIANKMLDALKLTMLFDNQVLDIGVSIGVADYPDHAKDMKQLLWCADTAMYAAKKAGKRCIRVYDAANPIV